MLIYFYAILDKSCNSTNKPISICNKRFSLFDVLRTPKRFFVYQFLTECKQRCPGIVPRQRCFLRPELVKSFNDLVYVRKIGGQKLFKAACIPKRLCLYHLSKRLAETFNSWPHEFARILVGVKPIHQRRNIQRQEILKRVRRFVDNKT